MSQNGGDMKTVQEWIRETNIEEIADTYFCEYPIEGESSFAISHVAEI